MNILKFAVCGLALNTSFSFGVDGDGYSTFQTPQTHIQTQVPQAPRKTKKPKLSHIVNLFNFLDNEAVENPVDNPNDNKENNPPA